MPFRAPYVTAEGIATHRQGFIVQIEAEDGLVGLGEVSYLPYEAGGLDTLEASLLSLAERAAGADMAEFGGGVSVKAESGWPAFAFAMTDLIARSRGESVASLFPREPADAVAVNALIGGGPVDEIVVASALAVAAGYRSLKLKVGIAASTAEEIERIAAVREEIGPRTGLRLDANGAWTEPEALALMKAALAYAIEYIEQPVAPGRIAGLKRLRDTKLVPIAADEDVHDLRSAERVLETGAADVLVLKPLQFAGLSQARAIAERAMMGGVRAVVTTSIDTGVGTALALQLAATLATDDAHGLATLPLLEDDLIVEPGLPVEHGEMRLPDEPGLGVELDEAAVDKYATAQWSFEA